MIDPVNFEIIGQGQEGRVIKYFDKDEDKFLVIKQIRREPSTLKIGRRIIDLSFEDVKLIYEEEVTFLKYLNNLHMNYFPRYYRSYETKDYFNIVMEYIHGVTLQSKLLQILQDNTNIRLEYGWQMYDLFLILAKNGLVYADLNRSNFIVTSTNDIKIVDFGLTCSDKTALVCNNTLISKIFEKKLSVRNMLLSVDVIVKSLVGNSASNISYTILEKFGETHTVKDLSDENLIYYYEQMIKRMKESLL